MSFVPENQPLAKPEALLRVPMGLASPLWGLFAGAAVTGATWWWMTRWARPANLEAMFGATAEAEAVAEPEVALLAAPDAAVIEAVAEAAPEPVIEPVIELVAEELVTEPVIEAAPEPVVAAAIEAPSEAIAESASETPVLVTPEALEPEIVEPAVVAGGAADVALETIPQPKPKRKAVAARAD